MSENGHHSNGHAVATVTPCERLNRYVHYDKGHLARHLRQLGQESPIDRLSVSDEVDLIRAQLLSAVQVLQTQQLAIELGNSETVTEQDVCAQQSHVLALAQLVITQVEKAAKIATAVEEIQWLENHQYLLRRVAEAVNRGLMSAAPDMAVESAALREAIVSEIESIPMPRRNGGELPAPDMRFV